MLVFFSVYRLALAPIFIISHIPYGRLTIFSLLGQEAKGWGEGSGSKKRIINCLFRSALIVVWLSRIYYSHVVCVYCWASIYFEGLCELQGGGVVYAVFLLRNMI